MAKTRAYLTAPTSQSYRGYLIRWSPFTLLKPDQRVWVEKDGAFICWANTVDHAKEKIDEVTTP